jgi:chorismate synthase
MTLRFLTAGESHGPGLVAILEGLPAGLPVPHAVIRRQLERRREGFGAGPRMKIEADGFRILSGVLDGVTIGSPVALWIENRDHAKWKGKAIEPLTIPRPGHADLSAATKYGYRDLRLSLERASARETAARVALGAICMHLLAQFHIRVGAYVVAIGGVTAQVEDMPLLQRAARAEEEAVRCPDAEAAAAMRAEIERAMAEKDTLGGLLEAFALGLPPGLGSHVHWDRRLDVRLGAAALSVPAVKGVEIGPAFENARLRGTQVQDPIRLQGDSLIRPSNRSGGLEGGITTGQPLLLRAAMKPIATTLTPQSSVDLWRGEETETEYQRSDFCPVPRAVPILEAVIALVLADALLEKLGGDCMEELISRFQALRRMRLADLPMDDKAHTYWQEEG